MTFESFMYSLCTQERLYCLDGGGERLHEGPGNVVRRGSTRE